MRSAAALQALSYLYPRRVVKVALEDSAGSLESSAGKHDE